MGDVYLNIHADVQDAVKGVNEVADSVKNLEDETQKYSKKTKEAFSTPKDDLKTLNNAIKEQEKLLKQVRQEEARLWAAQQKGHAINHKEWERVKNDVKAYEKELSELQNRQKGLQGETNKGTAIFNKLGAAIAGAFTVGAIINFAKQAGKALIDQEKAEAKLKAVTGGRVDVQQKLIEQANELQKTTLFTDEEIINAQALLSISTKDETQLKALTKATLDLATAKGIDLASATTAINQATLGQGRALKSLGIELDLTGSKEENVKTVTEALGQSLGGIAEKLNTGMTGSVNSFNDAWGELLESFGRLEQSGQGIVPFITEVLDSLTGLNNLIAKLDFSNVWRGFQAQIWGDDLKTVQAQLEQFDKGLVSGSEEIERRFKMSKRPLQELQEELVKVADENIRFAESNDEPAVLAFWKAYKQAVIGYSEEVKKSREEDIKAAEKAQKAAEDEAKERRKLWDEEQERIRQRMAMEADLQALRDGIKFDIQEMQEAEEKAAEAERKRLEEQQKAAEATITAVNKLTEAWQDEANVDDIPFNTEEVVKEYEKLNKFIEDHPLFAKLGFENEEQLEQVKDYVGKLFDFATQIVDQQVEATERIVDDQNQRIEEQEELVNREFELKKEGLANNFAVEQENLEKMQKARDNAIKDREKAIKIQKAMSTVESGVALVSAAANIIKGFSGIPIVGVALGLAAVGAMIAGFIVSQSKVKDAVQFGEGGLLTGKKHSQGGIRIPGTNIEVEGDEYVTNRRSTAKYLPLLEAINKDDREGMRLFFDRKFINRMPQQKFYDIDKSKKLGEIARNTRRNGKDIQYGPGYIIERDGGYTKKINLN